MKRSIHQEQVKFTLGSNIHLIWINIIINLVSHINRIHKDYFNRFRKVFEKKWTPFHSIIKTLNKLERERNFQPGKKSSVKILTSTIVNDERLKNFLLRLGIRQGYLLSSFHFNFLPEVLTRAIRQENALFKNKEMRATKMVQHSQCDSLH